MPQFKLRRDFLAPETGKALGATIVKPITRDFYIDAIWVFLTFTSTGAIATATADGLLNLLKRVTLQISDGSENRNCVDMSGRALIELAAMYTGALERNNALALGATAATSYTIAYPIFCNLPQLSDPIGSRLLLPAPGFNADPVLTLYLASQADIDSNASPTFAISGGVTVDVLVQKREVPAGYKTWSWELMESTKSFPSTLAAQRTELQIPGAYTMLMLRTYTSATARGDISISGGEFRLQLLGNVQHRFKPSQLQAINDHSFFPNTYTKYFTGLYALDFLSDYPGNTVYDLAGLLETNPLKDTGARLELIQDITGGAAVTQNIVSHRIFGDLSLGKFAKAA